MPTNFHHVSVSLPDNLTENQMTATHIKSKHDGKHVIFLETKQAYHFLDDTPSGGMYNSIMMTPETAEMMIDKLQDVLRRINDDVMKERAGEVVMAMSDG